MSKKKIIIGVLMAAIFVMMAFVPVPKCPFSIITCLAEE